MNVCDRFEWSVGESLYDEPAGIFDTTYERVWHDAGTATRWIYSLPRGLKPFS